jgi:hypothetical protein
VFKAWVSKSELERIALQEIRSYPGGENVISVEIESDPSQPHGMDWRLHVTASERADLDRIHQAAQTATRRLKRRYDLRSDS